MFSKIRGYDTISYNLHGCSNKKLKEEYKFTFCKICNHPTSHLGITPFS